MTAVSTACRTGIPIHPAHSVLFPTEVLIPLGVGAWEGSGAQGRFRTRDRCARRGGTTGSRGIQTGVRSAARGSGCGGVWLCLWCVQCCGHGARQGVRRARGRRPGGAHTAHPVLYRRDDIIRLPESDTPLATADTRERALSRLTSASLWRRPSGRQRNEESSGHLAAWACRERRRTGHLAAMRHGHIGPSGGCCCKGV